MRYETGTNNLDFPLTDHHHLLSAMAQEEISLEETNKIRVSLGLKPLTDDKAPASEDKEQQAEDNYARQREQETKARESK